jgi:competence protein ComEA
VAYLSGYRVPMILLISSVLMGCASKPQNPRDLKEKTAQATAQLKSDARAVASGIKEGWNRDKPLDVNSATREQLIGLPGVSSTQADHIIVGRPYDTPADLVARQIISKAEYDRISDRLTARR